MLLPCAADFEAGSFALVISFGVSVLLLFRRVDSPCGSVLARGWKTLPPRVRQKGELLGGSLVLEAYKSDVALAVTYLLQVVVIVSCSYLSRFGRFVEMALLLLTT